jgi:predicted SAM-dependent methyltransferase
MVRKANIGTRHWRQGWFHIDIDPSPLMDDRGGRHPVDLVCDAAQVPLPNGSFDHVFSSETIEHFSWRRTGLVILEWARLLTPGGTMRVETPDFLAACQQVLSHETLEMDLAIQQIVFAEQLNPNDFHFAGLTHRTLPHYFEQAGLRVANIERGWECGWLRVDGVKR